MKSFINKKSVLIILTCILIVGICVGMTVFVSGRRQYQTVTNSQAETQNSENLSDVTSILSSGGNIVEKKPISVSAPSDVPKTLDPVRYIKQAYELKRFMAVESFSSAQELSANVAVQYAFCYLYAGSGCLVDYKPAAMTYREATEQEIQEQIVKLFGSCPYDIKTSDLYSAGKQCFEMWQPDYSCEVYADAAVRVITSGNYEIEISYYEDAEKTKAGGTAVITVSKAENGTFFLTSMT